MSASRIKLWINVLTLLALAVLVYVSWSQILEAFSNLANLRLGLLVLMIPLQLLSYVAVAHMYYSYFKNTNTLEDLTLKEMYRVSLELNFVNHVFPSGGVSGFSFLGLRLRRYGITAASATLAQVVRYFLTFMSFLVILAFGAVFLALGDQVNGLVVLITTAVFVTMLFGVAVGIYIISNEKRVKAFTSFLPRIANFVLRKLRKKTSKNVINVTKIERVFGELHADYLLLTKNVGRLKIPFLWALAINLFELATIYTVFLAFGSVVNPGAVILAYAVANFAALVAILPGGIGIYESLMASVAATGGIEKGLAISATLVYRVVMLLVFVPIGFVFYQAAVNSKKVIRKEMQAAKEGKKNDR